MKKTDVFWNEYCSLHQLENVTYKDAFQFGAEPDCLADLVVEGKKTATTSGHVFYELENEPLPQAGEYSIVLNSSDEPVAIIKIDSVEVLPMDEVSEEFALAEGEGDYGFWWEAHENFFKNELKTYNLEFTPNMVVVCERFTKVFSK
ncbi:ASCH domain-containing protein [Cytobacillus gottheilii]|uniref:ASCH domain-containing protein n=1 Tax=Cytobacillus gottheilii TaxID=859144 RepID=A0ABX8FHN3_9BACI|nr:ASCH domain-containing protein [Cytobacillus gottheilii]QVY63488.1 ASCH domain-containing protein [Cytobacillus gottheilii]